MGCPPCSTLATWSGGLPWTRSAQVLWLALLLLVWQPPNAANVVGANRAASVLWHPAFIPQSRPVCNTSLDPKQSVHKAAVQHGCSSYEVAVQQAEVHASQQCRDSAWCRQAAEAHHAGGQGGGWARPALQPPWGSSWLRRATPRWWSPPTLPTPCRTLLTRCAWHWQLAAILPAVRASVGHLNLQGLAALYTALGHWQGGTD